MSAITEILGIERRMAPTPSKERSFSLGVQCSECGCHLRLPDIETTLMGKLERVDYMIQVAISKGWIAKKRNDHAWVICKGCQDDAEKIVHGPLPIFCDPCACAKCGNSDMSMKFCDGRKFCPMHSIRDHLHRGCPRCGYSFIQGCKDEKVPNAQT